MNPILIIDDNKYISFTLTEVIQDYGFKSITAKTCEEALKYIESGGNPPLIILDKKLPDGDGINLLRLLKQKQEYKGIPVIMLTAYADELSSLEAIKIGAHAFFCKPFNNEEIMKTIEKVLDKEKIDKEKSS